MRTINFEACPTGKHKGEIYTKIAERAVGRIFGTYRAYSWDKHEGYVSSIGDTFLITQGGIVVGEAVLDDVSVVKDYDRGVRVGADTFEDYTIEDFRDIMKNYYGYRGPVLTELSFTWTRTVPDNNVQDGAYELEPCPFCGSLAVLYKFMDVGGLVCEIECQGCFDRSASYSSANEAIEAWNRRVKK